VLCLALAANEKVFMKKGKFGTRQPVTDAGFCSKVVLIPKFHSIPPEGAFFSVVCTSFTNLFLIDGLAWRFAKPQQQSFGLQIRKSWAIGNTNVSGSFSSRQSHI
jgi:hypothetical protein